MVEPDYCINCYSKFTERYKKELVETLFKCTKCQYETLNVSDIIFHHKEKCHESQVGNGQSIDHIIFLLKIEKLKNKFYRSIIDNNTEIKLDDLIFDSHDDNELLKLSDDKLTSKIVNDSKVSGSISSTEIVKKPHVLSQETTTYDEKLEEKGEQSIVEKETVEFQKNSDSPDIKTRKMKYRTIKSCIELTEEKPQEYWVERINNIKTNILLELNNKYEDVGSSSTKFTQLLANIGSNRVYNKYVKQIPTLRRRMSGHCTLAGYINLIDNHNSRLFEVFKGKRMDDKKITNLLSSSLSAVEAKMLRIGEYYKQYSEVDDMQSLATILDNDVDSSENYVPFDVNIICEKMHNYGTVIFSIKKTIERYLGNRYGLYNLIYLPINKSSDEDPYSFYTLTMVDDKNKRYWSMDCRLEELSTTISSNILIYLVNSFRTLYKDIFGDNDYRSNYDNFCQESTEDFTQLTMNIILLANSKKFCDILRKIVKTNFTYFPSENDKFNIYGDDPLQRNKFKSSNEDNEEIISVIKRMFDGISQESANDFYLYTQR
jgi:hypothetical protein